MYAEKTQENYRKSLMWMGYPGRIANDEVQKPKSIPDNVCPICGKKMKNAKGVEVHKRMAHKGDA